jgi:hypothetical protein
MPRDFSRFVGKISEAKFAPEAWPESLESLTGALGVAGAACIISNKKASRVAIGGSLVETPSSWAG